MAGQSARPPGADAPQGGEDAAPAASDGGAQQVDAPEGLDGTGQALARIESGIEQLGALVDQRLSYDAVKEEAFERLYQDLEQFRGEATAQQLRPVMLDVILLLDRVDTALADLEAVRDPRELLSSFRDELIEILERRGVMALSRADAAFDPKVQRAVEVESAADRVEHNSVARVVRRGYISDGKVLRP